MNIKQTLGNNVCVRLDPENNYIQTKAGRLEIDNSFEPEKHVVRTGTVESAPKELIFQKNFVNYPWVTTGEILPGDRVVMYFMAVQNCLSKERKNYIKEGNTFWIFIQYKNIYAVIREGKIIPVNGFVLVEPVEDPAWVAKKEKYQRMNLEVVDLRGLSKTDVTYGKIAYIGSPNKSYADTEKSDDYYDLNPGDVVVMKRVRDIPIEYEYHAKLDGGRKLFRMQRHDILAKL